jgi:phage gpG-like protein
MIEIVLTGTEQVATRLRSIGPRVRENLINAVKIQWMLLQSHVVTQKLSSQVLHRVTGNLASSIHVGGPNTASAFEETPVSLVGRVGTKVRYAKVHEYGGAIQIKAHERRMTMVFGRPVAQRMISVGSYTAHYPERSFLRSSLQERADSIRVALKAAVSETARSI